jgi:hypothetical protein
MKQEYKKALAGLVLATSLAGPALADTFDITSGYLYLNNGVIFSAVDPKGSGTGNWDSIVRIKSEADFVKGVNTDINDVYNNLNGHTWTHDEVIGNVGTAGDYYLFQLDVGQSGNGPISLDRVKIYQHNGAFTASGDLTSFLGGTAGLVFDTGMTDTFKVSGNSGNGQGDLWMYVPKSLFSNDTDYLYLYSELGTPPGTYAATGSFEEWGALIGTAEPPPGHTNLPDGGMTLMLLTAGLSGLGLVRRVVKR